MVGSHNSRGEVELPTDAPEIHSIDQHMTIDVGLCMRAKHHKSPYGSFQQFTAILIPIQFLISFIRL